MSLIQKHCTVFIMLYFNHISIIALKYEEIANIDVKWKRFSAKIAPKTDWSQLGNSDCRSRFVDNFQKSREEGQDFVNAIHNV